MSIEVYDGTGTSKEVELPNNIYVHIDEANIGKQLWFSGPVDANRHLDRVVEALDIHKEVILIWKMRPDDPEAPVYRARLQGLMHVQENKILIQEYGWKR